MKALEYLPGKTGHLRMGLRGWPRAEATSFSNPADSATPDREDAAHKWPNLGTSALEGGLKGCNWEALHSCQLEGDGVMGSVAA